MAVEWQNGIPILTDDSLIGDVPEYTQLVAHLMPIGLIQAYAGDAGALAPYWLPCDGGPIPSEDRYDELRIRIGTTWGGNVPDLRGRAPIGVGQEGPVHNSDNYVLGGKYGDKRFQSHGHGLNDPGHNHHAMSAIGGDTSGVMASWTVGGASHLAGAAPFGYTGRHSSGISVQSAGGGGSNNVPPSLAVNFVILAATN